MKTKLEILYTLIIPEVVLIANQWSSSLIHILLITNFVDKVFIGFCYIKSQT